MVKALRIHRHGGPEVLCYEDVEIGDPAPDEVRLEQSAIGVNFTDITHRIARFSSFPMPMTLGVEAVGRVSAVGRGVKEFKVGDRAAYALCYGAYTAERNVPARLLCKVPDGISDRDVAAVITKGTTVVELFTRSRRVRRSETVLLHAAAGGVGLVACQWARAHGIALIGTTGSKEKAAVALAHGATHAIVYTEEDFVARVMEITGGRGVDYVIDGVGKGTMPGSLKCLAPYGTLSSYGVASGLPDIDYLGLPIATQFTRTSIGVLMGHTKSYRRSVERLFSLVLSGAIKPTIGAVFPLRDGARAQEKLHARRTSGSIILLPDGSPA